MDLLFQDLVKTNSEAFKLKVIEVAGKLAINPNWLMWIMRNESGLNPQAQNTTYLVNGEPATGLIQFINTTAKQLGTTIQDLYRMSNVQQMDYVYKYFKPYAGRMKSIYDVYLVTFFPLAIGKPDSWVFETKNISRGSIAHANPGFDLNKDGKITIGEFKQAIDKKITESQKPFIFTAAGGASLAVLFLLGIGAYLYFK